MAVLDHDCLMMDGLIVGLVDRYPWPSDMAALAEQHQLRQLWVTAEAVERMGLPEKIGRTDAQGLSAWTSGRLDSGSFFEVAVPSWDRTTSGGANPWKGLPGPAMLGELLEFTNATGMLWRVSAAVTSDAWLRSHYGKKLQTTQYPEVAGNANLEPDLWMHRAPEGRESRARYCHAYDVNAMYLAAASSLALPSGHYEEGGCALLPGARTPGYWRDTETGWVTTPTAALSMALDTGAPQAVYGFWWEEHHRWLEPWYKVLRDARKALLPFGPSPALDAVKQVYTHGIGRLGSTGRTMENDPLYQPYWRHAVQALARCNLQRALGKLSQAPVAIERDCCYFLTSTSDPARFAKKIGLPLDDQIGHFKIERTMPAKYAREALAEESTSTALAALREGIAA